MDNFILTAISPEGHYPNEAEKISELLSNEINFYHIRKPGFATKQIENLILQIPEKFYPQIALHSSYELILKYNIGGLHLPEKTRLSLIDLSKYIKRDTRISSSIHSLKIPEKAAEQNYSYVFLSPIFNSISKAGYQAAFTHAELQYFNQNCQVPVVALGGVTSEKIPLLKDLHFSGAALHGSLFPRTKN